jgi:hypothetical protein
MVTNCEILSTKFAKLCLRQLLLRLRGEMLRKILDTIFGHSCLQLSRASPNMQSLLRK